MGKYPTDWFEITRVSGFQEDRPGIYRWDIADGTSYIGRYTRISRPMHEYPKNVYRLLNGLPYRPSNPNGFRAVHRALANAIDDGAKITLTLVENCSPNMLNERERFHLASIPKERRLNGRAVEHRC